MKTFHDLVSEVQEPGLCHRCGGCVTFCTAINYGALTMGADGYPKFKNEADCIECGLCYMFCPETHELEAETRERLGWKEPLGNYHRLYVARASNPLVRDLGTDGGVVTAILLQLMESGKIDSAVVCRQTGPFSREPFLATSKRDILMAAGSSYDESAGGLALSRSYSTYAAWGMNLAQLKERNLSRVAFVGVPDQIMTMRKMQTLGVVPSGVVKYYFGLFCAKQFQFGEAERKRLEAMGKFSWDQVTKINLKDTFQIHLDNGNLLKLPLDDMDFMARPACGYCTDYSAEYADISFGGLGAPEGWTSVLTRTPEGKEAFREARDTVLEEMDPGKAGPVRESALELIRRFAEAKRARGISNMNRRAAQSGAELASA